MKNIFFLLLTIWGMGMTGCRTVAPVSHSIKTEVKEDSTTNKKESTKDSTTRSEKLNEKTLPEAKAGVILTTDKKDSLSRALGSLPKGAQVIYQDPKLRAQLKIYKDSLDRIHIECVATEQKYYEKEIQQTRYIEKLVSELTKVNKEKSTLEETVLQAKTPFWQRVKYYVFGVVMLFVLLLLFVGFVFYKMRLR